MRQSVEKGLRGRAMKTVLRLQIFMIVQWGALRLRGCSYSSSVLKDSDLTDVELCHPRKIARENVLHWKSTLSLTARSKNLCISSVVYHGGRLAIEAIPVRLWRLAHSLRPLGTSVK